MGEPVAPLELDLADLRALVGRAQDVLPPEDGRKLQAMVDTLARLTRLLENKRTTIARLRQLLFGVRTEKTRTVFPPPAERAEPEPPANGRRTRKAKGHGRSAAASYPGARRVSVSHPALHAGDACPQCSRGKVYALPAAVRVRIVGQAPLHADRYDLDRLRCHLCGEVFTAPAPQGMGETKYDETAPGMIALLKYGAGMPFYRLAGLQHSLGIPLPTSTQWDLAHEASLQLRPELIRQAAQGDIVYNDDTTMKILERLGPLPPPSSGSSNRRGVFTSGIVSTRAGARIALFFTGPQHAGENLAAVLAQRLAERDRPIQMCDALSRNLPQELRTLVANCLAHGRRKFVDVAAHFPTECQYVIDRLAQAYRHDAVAKQQALSPHERLHFHQAHSAPVMGTLQRWLVQQQQSHAVEPNSGLGQAIAYMLRHWHKLTLFLHVPGAPLDNNLCEQALKRAILHRKNSLFYKTQNGARVGDLYMSLIHTCRLCAVDPFDYLTQLLRHHAELHSAPAQWMPWNYTETLRGGGAPRAAPP